MKVFGITAPMTGSGKTTATLALLKLLERSMSFKIGPDFIDGQIHSAVSGKAPISIDRWLQGKRYFEVFARNGYGMEYGIVEGVMGFYDSGSQRNVSTSYYYEKFGLPYVLVVDISRLAESAYHIARGFIGRRTLGVILNNYRSNKHLEMVEKEFVKHGIRVIGRIPYRKDLVLPERHLGLHNDLDSGLINAIAEKAGRYIDLGFLKDVPDFPVSNAERIAPEYSGLRIFVARDQAFNFYYETSIRSLERIGTVQYFSPLNNEVPEDPDMIYIGGGYPELYSETLSRNTKTRGAILNSSKVGVPIIAECGGMMYLEKNIVDHSGKFDFVGVFPGSVTRNSGLTLNYTKLLSKGNSLLFRKGEVVYGHEFHYSSTNDGSHKTLRNIIGKGINGEDGLLVNNTFGSYSHFDLERYGKRLKKAIMGRL